MIELVRAYPEQVHPADPMERQNALEELNAMATIVAPLDHAALITDKRSGDIIYRTYGTGSGKLTLREGEEAGDAGLNIAALGSSENIAAVDALYATLTAIRDGLKSVASISQSGTKPFLPRFDRLSERIGGMITMIEAARSDLAGTAEADEATEGEAGPEGEAPATGGQTFTIAAPVGDITDHRAAYRTLKALEAYFVAQEPSSLALILLTQSRMLIGRPLVEAIDALLENNSNYATLTFGTEQGFSLSMHRMRELANQAGLPMNESLGEWQEGDADPPEVLSRDHAGALLKQLEEFFRLREPASPIPILLFKARNFLTKDFHSLVRELLPPSTS
jgi:type VI secretion system protein ImpA